MTSAQITAAALMNDFAERTGVTSARPPIRYLWTDAFAVCNFLGLERATGDGQHLDLALSLIEQVHRVLGHHRDPARGPLSGLGEREAALHPTLGGLRIGKPLPERRPDEPLDEELEWNRDGQYFHYLTRWMHALDQTARATRQLQFNTWARELAQTAFARFVHGGRLAWKMSVDLTRPLVSSTGQHDALEGYVTVLQMRATATQLGSAPPDDAALLEGFAALMVNRDWHTEDPLGIGGLLIDAWRLEQVAPGDALVERLLDDALAGLQTVVARGVLQRPANSRLAFRELGLAIGLRAAGLLARHRVGRSLRALTALSPMADAVERTWGSWAHRRGGNWTDHRDINDVMLATALSPEGFLVLPPV